VAAGWVALAEQVERIDREKPPVRDQENNRSVRYSVRRGKAASVYGLAVGTKDSPAGR
jgi:hypothetical protein